MALFGYDSTKLPEITLIGKDNRPFPRRNVSRVSEDYIYYFVTDGELFCAEDGKTYTLSQGDCFLFEPYKWHYGTSDSIHQMYYVHFKHDGIRRIDDEETLSDNILPLPKHITVHDHLLFNNLIALIKKAIEHNKEPLEKGDNALCSCAVQELFVYLSRAGENGGQKRPNVGVMQRIDDVVDYLNRHYSQKLTGDSIEKDLSYNFDYLNQLFRRYLDTTIFQMLQDIRMYNARKLILSSELSIESIALKVGYSDETYFSKVFKKHYGLSPMQYKKHEDAVANR